MITVQLDLPP